MKAPDKKVDRVTRLLLSLLRLLAANRSAAQSAARGRSAGQYRQPAPAPAHTGYGHARGYRHPGPARSRYAHSSAHPDGHYEDDDGRHNDDLGDIDADEYESRHAPVYDSADRMGYQDDDWLGDGHSDGRSSLDDLAHAAYVGAGEDPVRAGAAAPHRTGAY